MKKLLVSVLFFAVFNGLSQSVWAEEEFDFSKLHWGLEIMMMPNTSFGGSMLTGLTLQSDSYEAAISLNNLTSWGTGDNNSKNGKNSVTGLEVRTGKRWALGNYNSINVGVDFAPNYGFSNGVLQDGSYTVGPYVGLTRQFPKSNVLVSAFVIPYEYQQNPYNSANGGSSFQSNFMLDGGIGLDYLF